MSQALVIQSAKGQDITTSLIVAEVFGKNHAHVIRDIESLHCSEEFRVANFGYTPYVHPQNKQTYPAYEITKDGFSFLVMGYTGARAGEFKEKFIGEFNKREALLKNEDYILSRALNILQDRTRLLEAQVSQTQEQLVLAENTIKQQAPIVEYACKVLSADNGIASTVVANAFGKSANWLHAKLKERGIIWRVNGVWVLTAKYKGRGYDIIKTHPFTDSLGNQRSAHQTYWTEAGRKFIHEKLGEFLKDKAA